MRNLLRCRRGSVTFVAVIALVPLIGFVALGAEAGSWYITKQHAQNAADGAAYAGGLRLACLTAQQSGVSCPDITTATVDDRGKEVAAQNAFCNAGGTVYPGSKCTTPPTGTSRAVQIDIGTLDTSTNPPTWTTTASGQDVRATVSQQQPKYLVAVLPGVSSSPVTIPATAVARVEKLQKPPCILALKGSITFQGSPTLSSPNCGIASNSTDPNALGFKGNNGINLNAPSFSAGGCSQTGGSQCDEVTTHAPPVPDPLSAFNAAMSSVTPSSFSGGACVGPGLPKAYTAATPCYNAGSQSLSGTLTGTYFFSGTVSLPGGNGSVTTGPGGATLILFGNSASLSGGNGNPTFTLTAQTNPQVPPVLSSVRNLMTDLLIYDPEASSIKLTGSSSSFFNGTVYAPNAAVTYGGNTSVSSGCFQLIAASVKFFGNTNLDNSGCPLGTVKPLVQRVHLVY